MSHGAVLAELSNATSAGSSDSSSFKKKVTARLDKPTIPCVDQARDDNVQMS